MEVKQTQQLTMAAVLIIHFLLLLIWPAKTQASESQMIALPGCPSSCPHSPPGSPIIHYPFGIGPNCSFSPDFEVNCNTTLDGTTIMPYQGDDRIIEISLSSGEVRINTTIFESKCYNTSTKTNNSNELRWDVVTPYRFNYEKNKLIIIGCDTLAYLNFSNSENENYYTEGCVSMCGSLDGLTNGSCSGLGCCQIAIPKGSTTVEIHFDERFNNSKSFSRCSYVLIMEDSAFKFDTRYITTDELKHQERPILLDWFIGSETCDIAQANRSSYACKSEHSVCSNSNRGPGYPCHCSDGYGGNPYLKGGCQDINECAIGNPCSKPGKCRNSEGGYECTCPFGWRNKHNNRMECELNLAVVIGTSFFPDKHYFL